MMWTTAKMMVLALAMTACGQEGTNDREVRTGPAGVSGTNCYVTPNDEGAVIECGEESVQINHGEVGQTGQNGNDGANGTDGANGEDGEDGTSGTDGVDGKVVKAKTDMVYEGYYCSRTIVSIGNDYYLVYSGMINLTTAWYKVSSTCSVRVYKKKIYTK